MPAITASLDVSDAAWKMIGEMAGRVSLSVDEFLSGCLAKGLEVAADADFDKLLKAQRERGALEENLPF